MTKILVIEDEENIRNDLVKILHYEGFEAIGAENGRDGILLARQHKPELILCDILMPGLNGYQVLSILRGSPETDTIPFIFLTAKSSREDVRKGMRLGADDYLTKPFTVSELLSAIQTRLDRHKAMRRHAGDAQLKPAVTMPDDIQAALKGFLEFAHLLKTPEKLQGLEEVSEIGKVLVDNGQQLERAVENALIYTELKLLQQNTTGRENPWLSEESIAVEEFITFFSRHTAKQYRRERDLSLQLAHSTFSCSSRAFQKILSELLDNAFRYSEPGQGVRVVFSSNHQQEFLVQVFNEGMGMSQEYIHYIEGLLSFEGNPKPAPYGAGKGLLIAQMLAAFWGGTLRISSTQGIGTKAIVVFTPLSREEHNVTRNRVSR